MVECVNPVYFVEKYAIIKNMVEQKPKILMVDDELDQLNFFKSYFSRRNVLVFTAPNGEEALSLIKETKPDLVLLDIKLSASLDGKDVLRILREYDKETRVAIVTGDILDDKEVKELTDLGIVELLAKPFSLQDLENFIKKVLQGAYPNEIRFEQIRQPHSEAEDSLRRINHDLANITNDITSKCELYLLNNEEGLYKDKSENERLDIANKTIEYVSKVSEKLKDIIEKIASLVKKET